MIAVGLALSDERLVKKKSTLSFYTIVSSFVLAVASVKECPGYYYTDNE